MLRRSALLWSLAIAGCSAHAPPAQPSSNEQAQQAAAARELFLKGNELAREGDSVRAEQYLAAALRQGHDPEQVLPLLMRVCLTGSRLRSALNYAGPHLKEHPDAIWLRYLVATVYLGLNQPFHAREHLLAIAQRAPGHAQAQYLLGHLEWEGFGDRSAAVRHYRSYLQLEPKGQYAAEVTEWLRAHENSNVTPDLASPAAEGSAPETAVVAPPSPELGGGGGSPREADSPAPDSATDSRKPAP